jgi:hypothetical protein
MGYKVLERNSFRTKNYRKIAMLVSLVRRACPLYLWTRIIGRVFFGIVLLGSFVVGAFAAFSAIPVTGLFSILCYDQIAGSHFLLF